MAMIQDPIRYAICAPSSKAELLNMGGVLHQDGTIQSILIRRTPLRRCIEFEPLRTPATPALPFRPTEADAPPGKEVNIPICRNGNVSSRNSLT
jgi:hypothetical protein